ncbi:MAG TPA: fused MFS/spermidine synthase [Vicinamibacteria bacterium]|nr:fused MFS/spermidine synthase [Vicinamibacteria bacterium]
MGPNGALAPAPPARGGAVTLVLVAPLLFASGACALAYQTAWTREFRLVFGASTAASAAVVAVFMGGLGLGGRLIGPRADRHPNPLLFYARLEALVATTAVVTPWLLALVRQAYIALGGTAALGPQLGTLARLILAALVLFVPTVLAGGTLGAAARAVEQEGDAPRRATAVLYGVNTMGAVAGCLATTFFMLETFGTRHTLWLASLTNLLVALMAAVLARARVMGVPPVTDQGPTADRAVAASPRFVLAAAAIVGFAFFLMELVWYRMLGPILGGTVYTFGLVLAVALAGIALGGLAYPFVVGRRGPSLTAFALTCLAEAACLAVPYAIGDRLALLALRLRPGPGAGLWGHVEGWTVVTGIVVLPAAAVAGAQFPLLIALLGRGRDRVARHVGLAYFWNTVGGIAGALAGGFGLLPLLTAPGCWRAAALMLVALALAALLATPDRPPPVLALTFVGAAAVAVSLLALPGPTAAWRHGGVGVGRIMTLGPGPLRGPNGYRAWLNDSRRFVLWEREGVESSVAVQALAGLSFVVNGKIDGNARDDAPTQVMGGLLGALLRPEVHRSLVIGLGTGSTAGWLADVPGMERTDVVELEPAILHVARLCAPVNRRALDNPRVHVTTGDAREVLMTGRGQYDLVFSEPSNPYRAGIASLFTREFYQAVDSRLSPDGVFLQWVQAYEVDERTMSTILATLATVFPEVEVWQVHNVDLVLVASRRPLRHDAASLEARIRQEPFASALRNAWRVTDVSELLGAFVAGPPLARHVLDMGEEINTDDRNSVEFSFARMVAQKTVFDVKRMRAIAAALGADRPAVTGAIDWDRVARHRVEIYTIASDWATLPRRASAEERDRIIAHRFYANGRLADAVDTFRKQPRPPSGLVEIALFAEGLAERGDTDAAPYIRALGAAVPAEADAAAARLAYRLGRVDVAVDALVSAFTRYRGDPWPSQAAMERGLALAREIAAANPETAPRLYDALALPFSVRALEQERLFLCVLVARSGGLWERCREAMAPLERHLPWRPDMLQARADCYEHAGDPRAKRAAADLQEYLEADRSAPPPSPAAVPTVPALSPPPP